MRSRRALVIAGVLAMLAPLTPATAAPSVAALQAQAERIVVRTPGLLTVSAQCGARRVEVAGTRPVRAASTLKVLVALAAVRATGESAAGMGRDRTLYAAIVNSDNSAANVLIERAGGLAAVTRFGQRLGLQDTRLAARYGEAMGTMRKATTAADLRRLADHLRALEGRGTGALRRQGLTRAQAQSLVGLMRRSTYAGLIAGTVSADVAHKAGWNGALQNDVAIVRFPGRQACAVAVMSDGPGYDRARTTTAALMQTVVRPLALPRAR